jgi:phage tail-like protein
MNTDNQVSRYLDSLPAIFHEDPFLGRFLLAFEQILSGGVTDGLAPEESGQPQQLGLEEYIDQIHTYFRPYISPEQAKGADSKVAPVEFLPWLANWVALSLRDDWDEKTKRGFISRMVPLYRKRGTKEGLKELLELYVNVDKGPLDQSNVEIYEFEQPIHYFQVTMTLQERGDLQRKQAIARAILDQEKPAHTFYSLQILFPTMQIINEPATADQGLYLGLNTLLGTTT